jgi:hypothetical protein
VRKRQQLKNQQGSRNEDCTVVDCSQGLCRCIQQGMVCSRWISEGSMCLWDYTVFEILSCCSSIQQRMAQLWWISVDNTCQLDTKRHCWA